VHVALTIFLAYVVFVQDDGRTPLHCAADSGQREIMLLLISRYRSATIDVDVRDGKVSTIE
jgi:ankyrin repeat protein